ncbi:MAG: 50S ribosomal protein L6 [Bacteroidetes bacterium]|jgi:large subunit ribosomal protein L6|nr:50S ribosomal protein L6 [Bacteroidota bacterium]
MSRIGLAPVTVPTGVTVTIGEHNLVGIKGPKGELSQQLHPDMTITMEANVIRVERPTDQKRHKALHGLTRALLSNMVIGVHEGFKTEQEFVGVGYKVSVAGSLVEMALGYSHDIVFQLPKDIKATAVAEKGKAPLLTMESCNKQLLGQVAAKIRSLRKPEPYKGKGIKFKNEILRRKAGKSASKK